MKEMSDEIERMLRDEIERQTSELLKQNDEIERLKATIADKEKLLQIACDTGDRLHAEIEQLRVQIRAIANVAGLKFKADADEKALFDGIISFMQIMHHVHTDFHKIADIIHDYFGE